MQVNYLIVIIEQLCDNYTDFVVLCLELFNVTTIRIIQYRKFGENVFSREI